MKKILLVAILLVPGVAVGAGESSDYNKVYNWSYKAFGMAVKEMVNECSPVDFANFYSLGNWIVEKGGKFSKKDLVERCKNDRGLDRIERGYNGFACKLPWPNKCTSDNASCGEIRYPGVSLGCDIFVSNFIAWNNRYGKILRSKPGTYVEKVKNSNQYRVVDVVLFDGYKPGVYDNRNEYTENCKIYLISEDKEKEPTVLLGPTGEPLLTWTNDMFLNVSNTSDFEGGVRGVVDTSIFPDYDITLPIYKAFDKYKGANLALVKRGAESLPGGEFDVKNRLEFGATEEQYDDYYGVRFAGRIASYDFMGHFLFGMLVEDGGATNGMQEGLAQFLQGFDGGEESKKQQEAWVMGNKLVMDWDNTVGVDTRFANVELRGSNFVHPKTQEVLPQANQIARCAFINDFNLNNLKVHQISCLGDCKYAGSDFVHCNAVNDVGRVFKKSYQFNDICEKSQDVYRTWERLHNLNCKGVDVEHMVFY